MSSLQAAASARSTVLAVAACASVLLSACHRQGAAAAPGPAPAAIVTPYLSIHEALAKDTIEGIGGHAAAIESAAHAAGATSIETAARGLRPAATLADAREKFGVLSEAIVGYGKLHRWKLPTDVREAWCPMASKPWLQRGPTISNPYYGKEMPTCGEFK